MLQIIVALPQPEDTQLEPGFAPSFKVLPLYRSESGTHQKIQK
jgi:hypothetical protein